MKHIYIILFSLLLMFTSCDYLNVDSYFSDEIQMDSVFASKRNVEAYLWASAERHADEGQFYQGGSQLNPGPFATDEGFTMFATGSGYNGIRLILGEITASSMGDFANQYKINYMIIRECNTLLNRIDEAKDMTAIERAEIVANTKFVRAYAYYKLLIHFGPPIILGDEIVPSNETLEYYNRPRSTFDEAVEYICDELEAAAANLRVSLSLVNFGRPTKGAAYGLIARLRVYHASPLYNGGQAARTSFANWKRSTDNANYVSMEYDEKRWAIAAAACKRVMDLKDAGAPVYRLHTVDANLETPALPTNVDDPNFEKPFPEGAAGIDHFRSYSEMFNGESVIPTNPEYVWGRRSGTLRDITRMSFPTKNGGWNGACVTQKVVDAFRMSDGRTIYDSSEEYPYSEEGFTSTQKSFSGYRLNSGVYNMYANREMRFYASVGFSECYWPMSSATSSGHYNQTIKYYFDDANGKSNNPVDYPPTGYVIKKYIHPEDAWEGTNSRRMEKGYGIIRYADILLMYAESLNNLTTSHTVELGGEAITVSRDTEEISRAFNQVRYRAGLPGLTQEELADPVKLQSAVEQERMIEFLFEGQRYYDVRRWGIYEKTESVPITGMNVDGTKETYYRRTTPITPRIGGRVVNKKFNLLPLPLDEVRRLPLLDQNPGWEY